MFWHIYHRIRGFFKHKRGLNARIERKLSPETLAALKREGTFLRFSCGIEVNDLARGEKPGKPRPADNSGEEQLS